MRMQILLAVVLTLARVNGEPVTSQDIITLFSDRHSGHAKFLGGNAEAREFLKIVIDDKLLVQEAYEIGLDKDPAILQLASDLERERCQKLLLKTEIDDKAKPSRDDVKKIWESLNFVMKVRQIAVATRQEAEEIRVAILGGADIERIARECSRADSRSHGGHLVAAWGQQEPAWEEVVFKLEPGEVSPVIETSKGFEVVLVENRVDVERPPLEQVASRIEGVLYQRRLEDRRKEFLEELWQKYPFLYSPVARTTADPEAVIEPLLALEAAARRMGESPAIVEEVTKYREYLMESMLFRDHIFKGLAATDDESRRYYDEHKSEFVAPEQRRVAQILSNNEKDASAARQALAAGTEFAAAVKKYSRDPISAMQEGDLGWITPDRVPAAFKPVLTMGTGEVSKPIQSPGGWHLIKVLEIKPARQLAFEEVKTKAAQKTLEIKRDVERKRWVEKLRGAATIEIDDAAIKSFVKANEFSGTPPPQHTLQ